MKIPKQCCGKAPTVKRSDSVAWGGRGVVVICEVCQRQVGYEMMKDEISIPELRRAAVSAWNK